MRAPISLSPTAVGPSPLRILVADDNEVFRGAIEGLFRLLGHPVDLVSNGREAVEAAARVAYGLVMLDIQMPEMDGFEAARSIRARCPGGDRARIVGLSADGADGLACEASGMDAYLTKPVRLADLVGVLGLSRRD